MGWLSPAQAIPQLAVTRLIFCSKDSHLLNHPKTLDRPNVISDLAQGFLAWACSQIFISGLDFQKEHHMEMRQINRHTILGTHMFSAHMLEITDPRVERHWLIFRNSTQTHAQVHQTVVTSTRLTREATRTWTCASVPSPTPWCVINT